jgi:internalin A
MPLALIHRFTAKKLPFVFESNYWYTGIVVSDPKSNAIAMVHADKEAKRIYIRIKGESPLGLWEHIRREFDEIASTYARMKYDELVLIDDENEGIVNYEDLVSYVQAQKHVYFHPKLKRDFNVGYLIGLFENPDVTLEKLRQSETGSSDLVGVEISKAQPGIFLQILNNNSPTVTTTVSAVAEVSVDIQVIVNTASEVKGEAAYLLDIVKGHPDLEAALASIGKFADDAKEARNGSQIKEKGWSRKLKSLFNTIASAGGQIKNIQDGGEALRSMFKGLHELCAKFEMPDLAKAAETIIQQLQ